MTQRLTSKRIADHPDAKDITFQGVLAALVDPTRRKIVCQLAESHDHLTYDALNLPIAASTKTHHFRILRQAGLIYQYYVGTTRMNVLRRRDLEMALPGLLDAIINAANEDRRATAAYEAPSSIPRILVQRERRR